MGVGSYLILELEMANVGRTTATLIKLENLVPEGLQLNREKILNQVDDNSVDMKGKVPHTLIPDAELLLTYQSITTTCAIA